jgi:hypothetical protein
MSETSMTNNELETHKRRMLRFCQEKRSRLEQAISDLEFCYDTEKRYMSMGGANDFLRALNLLREEVRQDATNQNRQESAP